jgi:membrane-associated phospholipid phosphatase
MALLAAFVAGLLAVMVANIFWKVSIHTSIAAFFVLYQLTVVPAPIVFTAGIALLVLLGWSRVTLRAHTPDQVVAGAGIGVLVYLGYVTVLNDATWSAWT